MKKLCALLLLFFCVIGFASESFTVEKIRINGLQRITEQTVLEYLPVKVGQRLSSEETTDILNALYQTGFFSDVSLEREGSTLIINVQERSTIGLIKISGNKQLKTKDLLEALKHVGIAEGEAYNQATVSGMQQALLQQYSNLGRYTATVDIKVKQQNRNRVELDIQITEGVLTKVKSITFVGNHVFSQSQLRKNFQLLPHHWWRFLSSRDEYSAEKLDQDLNALRNFYYDHGYLKFKVVSSQADMTPDHKFVNIVVQVDEGSVYRIKGYALNGELLGQEAQVQQLINIKPNEVFSRKKVLGNVERIRRFYGNQGFAFAEVNVDPVLDEANNLVFINFDVKPGNRVYVRQINYVGNTRTADYVLRRETRQLEGSLFSLSQQEETQRRLNNLGYIEDVQMKVEPVPGAPNQVDLIYSLKEASSTTISAQAGYSDTYGLLYGANIVQKNFRGTGKSVSLGFDNSQYAQTYSFNYFNPYFTTSGISQGFSAYFQQTTPGQTNVSPYTLDTYGAMMNWRVPLSDHDYFSLGAGYEYLDIRSFAPSDVITSFVNQYGDHFNNAKITMGWTHNTFDRAVFPTRGISQWIGGEVGLPLLPDYLEYYKLNYNGIWYQPIWKGFIFSLNTQLGYGNGYGEFDNLPFFKNYYAGGFGTVRNYRANTLGPRDSLGNPVGGNILTAGSVNLIVPNGISERVRTSLYFDAGNVFQNGWASDQLRYSTGVEVDWASPMGLLRFYLGKALNSGCVPVNNTCLGDQTKTFDFSVGASI
jgi:outer membrane protein insertion porin family